MRANRRAENSGPRRPPFIDKVRATSWPLKTFARVVATSDLTDARCAEIAAGFARNAERVPRLRQES